MTYRVSVVAEVVRILKNPFLLIGTSEPFWILIVPATQISYVDKAIGIASRRHSSISILPERKQEHLSASPYSSDCIVWKDRLQKIRRESRIIIVAFRSAKVRTFAERKATMGQLFNEPLEASSLAITGRTVDNSVGLESHVKLKKYGAHG